MTAQVSTARAADTEGALARRGRLVVGGFYLVTGGTHLGIVVAGTSFYRHFADQALFAFVRHGWSQVFMAAPVLWGLCLFLGEVAFGTMLLRGGRWARVGWACVIAFHALLMLFGFGIWLWAIPALLVLGSLARADWPSLAGPASVR